MQAQSGDANLTIDGANVNAAVTENNGRGVQLSTGQAGNPNLTIEVKGGSLQASGQPNGIIFFTNKNNTQANANLKVSGNAMVKTSGITTEADGSGSQGAVLTTEAGTGETGGIVWIGSEGTVYGSVTLQDDLTISEGESLTIGDGASLTVPVGKTMTNNGTVTTTGSGTLINNGTINNSGTLPETISGNQPPKITTASLPDGKKYTAYNETLQADNTPTQWSITSGSLPAGLTLDTSTGLISGTPTADGTSTFTVKAENSAGSDSKVYTLKVIQTIRIKIIMTDSSVQYRYTEEGGIVASYPTGYAYFFKDGDTKTWINKGTQTYDADATIYAENMTLEKIPEKAATCTADGHSAYWYCAAFDKYFSDANGVNEITAESTVLPATGHGESEVKGAKEKVQRKRPAQKMATPGIKSARYAEKSWKEELS